MILSISCVLRTIKSPHPFWRTRAYSPIVVPPPFFLSIPHGKETLLRCNGRIRNWLCNSTIRVTQLVHQLAQGCHWVVLAAALAAGAPLSGSPVRLLICPRRCRFCLFI